MILWKHCPGSLRELPIPTPHLCLHTCILLQFHIYRDLHQILKTAIENTQMQQLWITYAYPPLHTGINAKGHTSANYCYLKVELQKHWKRLPVPFSTEPQRWKWKNEYFLEPSVWEANANSLCSWFILCISFHVRNCFGERPFYSSQSAQAHSREEEGQNHMDHFYVGDLERRKLSW